MAIIVATGLVPDSEFACSARPFPCGLSVHSAGLLPRKVVQNLPLARSATLAVVCGAMLRPAFSPTSSEVTVVHTAPA
jgi:hypothetical protein